MEYTMNFTECYAYLDSISSHRLLDYKENTLYCSEMYAEFLQKKLYNNALNHYIGNVSAAPMIYVVVHM